MWCTYVHGHKPTAIMQQPLHGKSYQHLWNLVLPPVRPWTAGTTSQHITDKAGADLSGRGIISHRHNNRLHARGRGGAARLDWRRRQRAAVSGQRGRVQTMQALRAAGRLQARASSTLQWRLWGRWVLGSVAQDPNCASTAQPRNSRLAEANQQPSLPSQATDLAIDSGKAMHSTEALSG